MIEKHHQLFLSVLIELFDFSNLLTEFRVGRNKYVIQKSNFNKQTQNQETFFRPV